MLLDFCSTAYLGFYRIVIMEESLGSNVHKPFSVYFSFKGFEGHGARSIEGLKFQAWAFGWTRERD